MKKLPNEKQLEYFELCKKFGEKRINSELKEMKAIRAEFIASMKTLDVVKAISWFDNEISETQLRDLDTQFLKLPYEVRKPYEASCERFAEERKERNWEKMKSTKMEFLALIKQPLIESMFRELIQYFDDEISQCRKKEQAYKANLRNAQGKLDKRMRFIRSSTKYLVDTQDALIKSQKSTKYLSVKRT